MNEIEKNTIKNFLEEFKALIIEEKYTDMDVRSLLMTAETLFSECDRLKNQGKTALTLLSHSLKDNRI